ncbi:hypothetical protein [Micromonospora deserti]|uniref:Uncharacterized protein n=1 Tax=Micromonospora deserti TaxID=2070366 RepID=A0A2W2DPX7_9ACTN|nr:hypothetical protein [Micromonospora deserti]PZG03010.1 hypothetical protein C1I99_00110 [Micromonospora deserti]
MTVTPARTSEYVNWADWRVRVAPVDGVPEDFPVPAHYRTVPTGVVGGPVANIAALYLATAIRDNRPAHPDFTPPYATNAPSPPSTRPHAPACGCSALRSKTGHAAEGWCVAPRRLT